MQLSIIIPTYNSANVIARALRSILSQSFTDYEVLIMDGQSTDQTADVVRSYVDSRIKMYIEPDKGVYDAMNKGITRASGEWVYFLGSDDWFYNDDVLQSVFAKENIEDYDVVYGDSESPHLSSRNNGKWTINELIYNRCHQSIFYKRYFLNKVGGYNLKYRTQADHDLNLKWFLDSRYSHLYIDVIIAHFSPGGLSGRGADENFLDDWDRLVLFRGWGKLSWKQRSTHLYDMIQKGRIGRFCLGLYSFVKRFLRSL